MAAEGDLDQINSIFEYYVANTVVSFLIKDPPPEYVNSRFRACRERGLPYIVAERDNADGTPRIVGYASASAFRGFMLGYGHTAEMTIFSHPDHIGTGIGSVLMKDLLARLKATKHRFSEAGHEDDVKEFEIHQVLAIMAVDDQRPDKGLGLRDWYKKWGFEEVGHLRRVGFKHGRW